MEFTQQSEILKLITTRAATSINIFHLRGLRARSRGELQHTRCVALGVRFDGEVLLRQRA